eukprot:10595648-Lingulodinium_polyedra.AAC.1
MHHWRLETLDPSRNFNNVKILDRFGTLHPGRGHAGATCPGSLGSIATSQSNPWQYFAPKTNS